MRILHINSSDISGGAAKVAWELNRAYRARGFESWLAVGRRVSNDPAVLQIPNGEGTGLWSRSWLKVSSCLTKLDQGGRLSRLCGKLATPTAVLDSCRGVENFHFPGASRVLELTYHRPDIVHCHNLHAEYFDLRSLSWLSYEVPTLLMLHDTWLLSGHCAYSLDCERWKIGCGQCPDLTLYPPIRRDATAYNWRRKRAIYEASRLYVATPSRWLMDKVQRSMLMPGLVEARVIPNGVDLTIFHPEDRKKARASLALPQDARILLFTANGIRTNSWKDFRTLRDAIGRVGERVEGQKVLLLALGGDGRAERAGRAEIRFVPYQNSPEVVARYYQATDLYVHAARADTFPTAILEALACGTPVIATAIGGIPEQVKGLGTKDGSINRYRLDEATGFLTLPQNAEELAVRIEQLLKDDSLRPRLSQNAAKDARERFDLERQVDTYLEWYEEIRAAFKRADGKGYEREMRS